MNIPARVAEGPAFKSRRMARDRRGCRAGGNGRGREKRELRPQAADAASGPTSADATARDAKPDPRRRYGSPASEAVFTVIAQYMRYGAKRPSSMARHRA